MPIYCASLKHVWYEKKQVFGCLLLWKFFICTKYKPSRSLDLSGLFKQAVVLDLMILKQACTKESLAKKAWNYLHFLHARSAFVQAVWFAKRSFHKLVDTPFLSLFFCHDDNINPFSMLLNTSWCTQKVAFVRNLLNMAHVVVGWSYSIWQNNPNLVKLSLAIRFKDVTKREYLKDDKGRL